MEKNKDICQLIKDGIEKSFDDKDNEVDEKLIISDPKTSNDYFKNSMPRDGMSAESAVFQIGKCAINKHLKVQEVKNKGRYYIANVLDKYGKLVNEIMVDKLNGRVRFIR